MTLNMASNMALNMASNMNLAILIPAAGSSSRLGQSKQLVKIDKCPLLLNRIELCADVLSKIDGKVYCVLGANVDEIRRQVFTSYCEFMWCEQWQKGLAHSIAFGIKQLPQQTSAVLILLSDQWALKKEDIEQLIQQYQQNPTKIIASHYNDTLGVPAIFPRQYFDKLSNVNAQFQHIGAKKLLQQHRDDVIAIDLSNAQFDLDTPAQLEHLNLEYMQVNE